MKFGRLSRYASLGAALALGHSLWGQEPVKPTHTLVPDGAVRRPAGGAEDECNVEDQLTRKMVFSEAEKFASQLFVGTFAVANKYREVREAPTMQAIAVPNDRSGEAVKKLLQAHHSYTTSSASSGASSGDGAVSSGKFVATVPPALLAVVAVGSLTEVGGNGAFVYQGRSLRLGLKSLVGSAAVSSAAVWSGNAILSKTLPQTALELTLAEQKQIRDQLAQGMDAPAKFLGDVLQWSEAQRGQFSRALNRKVIDTLVKSASGTAQRVDDDGQAYPIEARIVADLAEISFVDLIRAENLANEDQLKALKQLQDLQDTARKLQTTDITPADARKALGADAKIKAPEIEKRDVRERILALLRLHRLLVQTEKELAPGQAKEDVKKLIAETTKAVETIRTLCELGK